MVHLVEFEEPAASLVRLVETTNPDEMIGIAIQRLRDGTATDDMLTAAGLAVSCCTELPPGHHGGPVHPVSGLFAARGLAKRLSGEQCKVWRSPTPIFTPTTWVPAPCRSWISLH